MVDDWQTTTVGKFTPFTYGKSLPQKIRNEAGLIPVYGSNGIVGYHNKALTEKPTIIIGRKGTVGTVHYSKKPCWVIDTAFYITDVPDGNLLFTYYLLKNLRLDRLNSDSAVPGLNRDDAHFQKIKVPPLPEQKAIARILSSLDDKIELNQQMNRTLEAQARAIFKSWFVDFDPVRAKMEGRQPAGMDAATAALFPDAFEESELGLIPKGWSVRKLGDLAQNISETFDFSINSEIVFVNTGDVLSGHFLHENRVSKKGLPGQAKKSIRPNDILMSEIRPANKRYALVDFDSSNYVVSTKFMIIRASDDIETKLLYRILTLKETLAEFQMIAESRSGTFPQITFSSISYFPIILAPKKIQLAFTNVISSFENQIKINYFQSRTLATLRDFLLPKLMSGEIRVKDAEKMLEKVA